MRAVFIAIAAVAAWGCDSNKQSEHTRDMMPEAIAPMVNAGPANPPVTAAQPSGHLDDDGPRTGSNLPSDRPHRGHPIDVVLRSTPNGASVAVDGLVIGTTPTNWNGAADGREHEFTFVLPGHSIARYRFVPITSGTIHARLMPVAEEPDAGVAAPAAAAPTAPTAPPAPAESTAE